MKSTIYNYIVFIAPIIVCIHACGEEDSYKIEVGTLSQAHLTEAIVFQIAASEFPDVRDHVMPYSVTIKRSGACPGGAPACSYVDGQIFIYKDNPEDAMASLAHELIHVVGWSYGQYLGCPDASKPCFDLPWLERHRGPYFKDGPHDSCYTWEHCARVFLADQLFPGNRGQSFAHDLEACYAAYGVID